MFADFGKLIGKKYSACITTAEDVVDLEVERR